MRYLLPILLCFFPSIVLAGPFDPTPTDKSVEILELFGTMGTVLSGQANPVLQQIFEKLNWAVVSGAVIILGYITIVSIINTAQEGQVMGRKWSSVWIPMRSMIGILLMVPVASQGYSVIQALIMWIAIQGVGLADAIWGVILDNLAKGISATVAIRLDPNDKTTIDTNAKNAFLDALNASTCQQVLKSIGRGAIKVNTTDNDLKDLIRDFSKIKPYYDRPTKQGDAGYQVALFKQLSIKGKYHIGVKNHPKLSKICGSWDLNTTVSADEVKDGSAVEVEQKARDLYITKIQVINKLLADTRVISRRIVSSIPKIVEAENVLQYRNLSRDMIRGTKAAETINKIVENSRGLRYKNQQAVLNILSGQTKFNSGYNRMNELAKQGKAAGWAIAGSYYFALNKSPIQSLLNSAKEPFKYTPVNYKEHENIKGTYIDDYLNNMKNVTDEYLEASKGSSAATFDAANLGQAGIATKFDLTKKLVEEISKWVKKAFTLFVSALTDSGLDPLVTMALLGQGIMATAEAMWLGLSALSLGASLLAACSAKSPIFMSIFMASFTIFTIAIGLIMSLYTIGVSLGLYIPMVPYIIFTTGVLGWALLVIEAVVAGPIIALGIVSPSQDELGKIMPALMILGNIFLRPTLMIIGFIISAKLLQAIVNFVNFGFFQTMIMVLNPTMGDEIGGTLGHLHTAKTIGVGVLTAGATGFNPFSVGGLALGGGAFGASAVAQSIMPAGIFGPLFVIIIYTVLIISITNRIFSLVYTLPDKIMRWIGGGAESVGQEMGRIGDETKQGFEKGKSQVDQGMQAASTKATERLSSEMETARQKADKKSQYRSDD